MVSNIQQYYRVGDSLNPDVWFEPTEVQGLCFALTDICETAFCLTTYIWLWFKVWEVKAADLTISPVHRAATGIVDPDKVFTLSFIYLVWIHLIFDIELFD